MPLQNPTVKYIVDAIKNNSKEFEAQGRVLRLKQYLGINARPPVMNAVLDALMENTLVEALYIQNFEDVRPLPQPTSGLASHAAALAGRCQRPSQLENVRKLDVHISPHCRGGSL